MCIVWVSTHIYTALQTNNPQQNKTPTCNSVVLLPQAILKEIWRIFGFGRRTTWTQNSNQTEVLWSRKVVRTSLKSQCDISDSTVILWNYENSRTLAPASALWYSREWRQRVMWKRRNVTLSVKSRLKSQNLIMRKQASKFDFNLWHDLTQSILKI